MLLNEVMQLNDDALIMGEVIRKERYLLINNSNLMPPAKVLINHFRVKAPISLLSAICRFAEDRFAGLTLAAYGVDRYQPEHVALLNLIHDAIFKTVSCMLENIDRDSRARNAVSSIEEIRELLEHQRIDLTLNSQNGLKTVINQVEQVGPLESPVLITGETGVGKELVARLIHGVSRRCDAPFITVNCGALPESLLDSELFGYEKGAFTGAEDTRVGYFEQADTGILFLDEVGELSLQAQAKLLRVLQHQTFQRVGGCRPVTVDVRVIAATHRDLPALIRAGTFRQDLWFRLNVFPIEVPPLRKRKDDMPILVQYLVNSKLYEMNLSFEPDLSPEVMEKLTAYDWPGNIRELQNVLERALILSDGGRLRIPDLAPRPMDGSGASPTPSAANGRFLSMDEMITRHIHESLKLSNGKVGGPGGAAELLQMHPSTLRARMKKLNISTRREISVPHGGK